MLVCISSATAAAEQDKPATRSWIANFSPRWRNTMQVNLPRRRPSSRRLLPYVPNSFEIQELLGLVYAAQSEDAKAMEHLETAVRLKPDSAAARTNLAASLAHSGKAGFGRGTIPQGARPRASRLTTPTTIWASFYIQSGKIADARPLLEQAQTNQSLLLRQWLRSGDGRLSLTGQLAEARQLIQSLMQQKNTGELHNLLGQIEEKDGKFRAGGQRV